MPTVWIETSSGCGGTIPKMVDLDGADEILSDIHQACDMYSYHTPAALYWQVSSLHCYSAGSPQERSSRSFAPRVRGTFSMSAGWRS